MPKMRTKKKMERHTGVVKKDLLAAKINPDTRYDMTHDRGEWYKAYTVGAFNYQSTHHHCTELSKVRCNHHCTELSKVRCNMCKRT